MIKKCPKCESIAVVYEDYVGGTSYYRCQTCGYRGSDFERPTVFDRIIQSEETLTEKLLYWEQNPPESGWTSNIIRDVYRKYEEAYSATLAKLKEVANGN